MSAKDRVITEIEESLTEPKSLARRTYEMRQSPAKEQKLHPSKFSTENKTLDLPRQVEKKKVAPKKKKQPKKYHLDRFISTTTRTKLRQKKKSPRSIMNKSQNDAPSTEQVHQKRKEILTRSVTKNKSFVDQ